MRSAARWLGTFVLGGIGGAACDQIHVRFGVLVYPRVDLLGQPWWVAPVFGAAAVVVLEAVGPFSAQAARMLPPRGGVSLAAQAVWFFGAYLASGIFSGHPHALVAAFGAAFLLRLAFRPDRAQIFEFGVLLAFAGTAFESWLCSRGAFRYTHPDLGLVAVWLPGLYLHGAPLAISVGRRLRAPARRA